jgi:hypothetical protein
MPGGMTDQRDSLLREVDEELRRERLLKLWEQYGTYILAGAVLFVAAVGGYKYFEHRRAQAAEAAGARMAVASRSTAQNKTAEAQKALDDLVATGPSSYAVLARLRLAAAERAAGKTAEAAAAYEAIAKASGVDPLLADYARLQAAMLRLDGASWTDMQNRLNDLAADGNAWRFSARELLGLAAQKAGKTEEARKYFQGLLGDRNTPPGVGERARVMMAMLTEAELTSTAPPSSPGAQAPQAAKEPAAAVDDKSKPNAAKKQAK